MKKLFSILALFILSCSDPRRPAAPPPDDAGIAPQCDDFSDARLFDTRNCGVCGNSCLTLDSDRCNNGSCFCGPGLEVCTGDQDCRFGRCIEKDPDGEICEFDEDCVYDGIGCIEGKCTRINCVPEVCDGFDNDCDGEVDNVGGTPLAQYCWPSEYPESTIDPCRRGVQVCTDGAWSECTGAVTPMFEAGRLACDGVDNDCDGCIDSSMTPEGYCDNVPSGGLDIVFLVDVSGSMASEIETLAEAIQIFASSASQIENRFALLTFPSARASVLYDYISVRTPLVQYADFEPHVMSLGTEDQGSNESSYDGIIRAADDDLFVSLNWRERASRIIIVLTDEVGQSVRWPPVMESEMCMHLTHGETLAVLGTQDLVLMSFDECADHLLLWNTDEAQDAADLLDQIIREPCE